MNKILLNNEAYKVTEADLPYLIVYGDKSGGSHFTITLMANLFSSGSKILFLTAFPMAKDNFLEQIGQDHSNIAFVDSVENLQGSENKQVIILKSGDEALFLEAVKRIGDINERVILIKNIEVFSQEVFDNSLNFDKLILSGNIDICVARNQILKKSYKTMVVFTKPEVMLPIEVPALEKWTAYLSSPIKEGIVKVEMN